jgi:glycosyltransferase involved in cell wall biosynthesis
VKQVTVVIPAYNAAPWLKETLNSVLSQSVEELEVLLIDDGSTDDTAEQALQLAKHDPRLRVIQKSNTGVSDTRNTGLHEASGEFIVFLDADDVLPKGFLSTRVDYLRTHAACALCGSDIVILGKNGTVQQTDMHAPGEAMLREILLYAPEISSIPGNMMYRTSELRKHGLLFDSRLSSLADKFFLIGVASKGLRCGYFSGSPLHYRVHAASMSHRLTPAIFRENKVYLERILEEIQLPVELRRQVMIRNYYILAGMARRLHIYNECVVFAIRWALSGITRFFAIR